MIGLVVAGHGLFAEGMNTEQLSAKQIIVLSGTNLPMIITAATMASFSE